MIDSRPGIVQIPGYFFSLPMFAAIMVSVFVNGQVQQVEVDSTVADLLARLKMNPKFLAVELNRQVVPRSEHVRTKLAADDQLEIVTLVGGG